jgi:predicted RNA-binding protein associated with RNAse of E/G family
MKKLMKEQSYFQPGQTILLREIWQNRIWSARPAIVVQDTPELMTFYIPAGNGTAWKRAIALDGTPVTIENRLQLEWVLEDVEWLGYDLLRMSIPGANYSVLIFWNTEDSSQQRWYINLEDPLKRTVLGFDYFDQILDIIATPDLTSWYWEDEDELEKAISLGFISPARADTLRSEGEKAIVWLQSGKSPFNGWEKWRPDPSWAVPVLPKGWDTI